MNDFDDIFKSALDHHEEIPPPQIWNKVENKLDKDEAAVYRKKYLLILRTASIFIIFVCGFAAYTAFNHFHDKNIIDQKNNAVTLSNQNSSPYLHDNRSTNSGNQINLSDSKNTIISQGSSENNFQLNTNTENKKSGFALNNFSTENPKNIVENDLKNEFAQKDLNGDDNSIDKTVAVSNPLQERLLAEEEEKNNNYISGENEQPELSSLIVSDHYFNTTQLISAERITAARLLFASSLSAKNNKQASVKKDQTKNLNLPGRFSLTAFFSPDIAGSSLQEEYNYGNENKSQICDGEKSTFSYTTGALVQYQLSKKWALQSGVTFSSLTASIAPKVVLAAKDGDGKIKFQMPTSYGLVNIKNDDNAIPQVGDSLRLPNSSSLHLHYFTIPVLIKYSLLNKGRFGFNASVGGGLNIITDAEMETTFLVNSNATKENITDIEGIKKSNGSAMFGLEALYHFNKKISLSVQPILRYSVNPLNQNVPVKNSPYSIGFMAGITMPL